jgi:hypothetical protein
MPMNLILNDQYLALNHSYLFSELEIKQKNINV